MTIPRQAGEESTLILDTGDIALRLAAAAASGALIGLNRDMAKAPIGARTLGLVSLGAATVTVAAVQIPGMAENSDALSRVIQGVIQGVMAGISFIGAGVILRDPQSGTVDGLTTAAAVWVTAALGIACGLASWTTVGLSLVLAVVLLAGLRFVRKFYSAKTD